MRRHGARLRLLLWIKWDMVWSRRVWPFSYVWRWAVRSVDRLYEAEHPS